MKNNTANYQNLNVAARVGLGALGAAMLVAFYAATIGGATLGSGVYLAIFSVVPITMAIIGWSPLVFAGYEREEENIIF